MHDSGYANSTVFFAFLAGAASGAVVALLLAPKSGRETRSDIKHAGQALAHAAVSVPPAMRAAYDSASVAAVNAFHESLREEGVASPSRS